MEDNRMEYDDVIDVENVQFKDNGNLDDMYEKIAGYEARIHEENQKRIKVGIRCLWIVPMIFLVLMFLTDSSKLIFLVLWIVSLFAIAIYLIYVEYSDHKIQEQMNEIRGIEESETESLINVEEHRAKAEEFLDERRENNKEAMRSLFGRGDANKNKEEQANDMNQEGGEES